MREKRVKKPKLPKWNGTLFTVVQPIASGGWYLAGVFTNGYKAVAFMDSLEDSSLILNVKLNMDVLGSKNDIATVLARIALKEKDK